MDKNYFLFDFQWILKNVMNRPGDEDKKLRFKKVLEGIDQDAVVEDLPFYKTYLSRFDVEWALDGYKLAAEDGESVATRDDLLMLYRFVAASFSSSYDFVYDEETNSVELQITVKSGDTILTKTIAELYSIQIVRLFEIYLNEQIDLFSLQCEEDEDSEYTESEQKQNVMLFEKKVRQLRDLQGSKEIRADLDDLLNG